MSDHGHLSLDESNCESEDQNSNQSNDENGYIVCSSECDHNLCASDSGSECVYNLYLSSTTESDSQSICDYNNSKSTSESISHTITDDKNSSSTSESTSRNIRNCNNSNSTSGSTSHTIYDKNSSSTPVSNSHSIIVITGYKVKIK